jgi:HSF-type DNA-binding
MIDSCDPTVASWSEDGETFVVKDPTKFESEIIPQFFKHSKFTSFVRQLNFYSFRKIKYVDTIRLDPKLEAETANFWRFKHEKFQRGKPHLLTEIKRMNGHKTSSSAPSKSKKVTAAAPETKPTESVGENSNEMKQELDTLKKRIEEMNKNMSELTSMVQKVTLKPNVVASSPEPDSDVPPGAKRKKIDVPDLAAIPESVSSTPTAAASASPPMEEDDDDAEIVSGNPLPVGAGNDVGSLIRPDEMLSSNLDFEEVLPMLTDDPVQLQALTSDDNSADRVFNEFEAEDALIDLCHNSDEIMEDTTAAHLLPDPSTGQAPLAAPFEPLPGTSTISREVRRKDRADPELMDRLSEALAVLPKSMQEQIVERLIAAITTTDLFASSSARKEQIAVETEQESISLSDDEEGTNANTPEVGMPLAAATLAALLSHYSAQVKKSKESSKDNASRSGVKSIPVIPVHA